MENCEEINKSMQAYKKRMYETMYDTMSKEELVNKMIEMEEKINIRNSIKTDSFWISKYDSLNCNLYMLSHDLVREHEYLQRDVYNLTAHNKVLINMIVRLSNKPSEEVMKEISRTYLEMIKNEDFKEEKRKASQDR